MADLADIANDLMQERIDQALAARKAPPVGHSLLFCDDCAEAIPEARRLAIQGCRLCVACQSLGEQRNTRHA